MAYTKTDWACGDKITAEKLNKIEQGIVDAQNGYECTQGWTTLTEESVVTTMGKRLAEGTLECSEWITADKIKVTFNGTEYMCNREAGDTETVYLYDDHDTYPFQIRSSRIEIMGSTTISNTLYTPSAGTYTVKIEAANESINTTECFEKAVKSLMSEPLILKVVKTMHPESGSTVTIYDKTGEQVTAAWQKGVPIYVENLSSGIVDEDAFVLAQYYRYNEKFGANLGVNYIDGSTTPPTVTFAGLTVVPSSATGEAAQYAGHMNYYRSGGIS